MSKRTGKADPRPRGPQVDKWGYLNNPRWMKAEPQAIGGNLIGGTGWNPNRHLPCGHWHKRGVYARNITVPHSCYQDVNLKTYIDKNGQQQVWCPFVLWMDEAPYGMLAMVYDTGGRVWVPGEGMVYKDGTTLDEEPLYDLVLAPGWSTVDWDYSYLTAGETARYPAVEVIDENFWAYTSESYSYSIYQDPGYHIFVWVVRDGVVTRHLVWSESDDNCWVFHEPTSMAIKENGTIIVVALRHVWPVEGEEEYYEAVVWVSNNYGVTWEETVLRSINALGNEWYGYSIRVKKDSDGNFYITFDHYPVGRLLYKSTDDGQSWLLENTLALPSPPETPGQLEYVFWTFDENDIYICDPFYQDWSGPPPQGKSVDFWKSTDGGSSFLLAIENLHFYNFGWYMCGFGVRDNVWFITADAYDPVTATHQDGIYRSTDGGSNWTKVFSFVSSYQLWWDWQSYRHDGDVWVWASAEMYQTPDTLLAFMMSRDNGETWQVIKSPVAFTGSFTQIPIYALEPQVWTLPFGNGYSNNF